MNPGEDDNKLGWWALQTPQILDGMVNDSTGWFSFTTTNPAP